MLSALSAASVEYLVVGAYALAAHGLPRATGDIDIWVRATPDNVDRVLRALRAFGAPLFELTRDDLLRSDTVFQIGVVPNRIDLLTGVTGLTFEEAWPSRVLTTVEGLTVPVIGREELLRNKEATGRPHWPTPPGCETAERSRARRANMSRKSVLIALAFGLAAGAGPLGPASAHHGWSGYDSSKVLNLTGTVRESGYEHPHGFIKFEVPGKTWLVVLAPPSRMENRGLARASLVPGTAATVVGYPNRNDPDEMRAERITVNGKTVELR
jgi:hypothetical protein